MIETLREIGRNIWHVGRLAIPGVALFELLRYLLSEFITIARDFITDRFTQVWARVTSQFEVLRVDLSPSSEMLSWVAKFNSIIPLSEMWSFFLLYLAVASVVLGVKWARNLIPGLK